MLDIETTGLYTRTDRIVEIALIKLDRSGAEVASWTTLVDPQRDIGASHIHGLRSRHLRGAPPFSAIAHELLAMMAGTVVVAHNARFDAAFLHAECARAGVPWGPIETLCTMTITGRLGLVSGRSLIVCCEEMGIDLSDHHTAMADARAASAILRRLLPPNRFDVPAFAPAWPMPSTHVAVRMRTDPPMARQAGGLGLLASHVAAPDDVEVERDAAVSYLALLDRILEDRQITTDEVSALAALAEEWGISASTARRLHIAYLNGVWRLALADGMLTDAERFDVEAVAELLGVPLEEADHRATAADRAVEDHRAARAREDLVGKTVCFTGDSVCSIDGFDLARDDQERLAARAGLIVKSGVSGRLDILVLADPDSQSGKARKAAQLGVRRIAEPVFWRMLDIPID